MYPLFITPYVRCLSPLIKLAVHQPYVRCLPPLPMCPQFRKGDCQPFTLQKLTTGYKPITSSLQAAGLVTPRKACYKGFVKHYEGASFVTKLVTKLVMHYEYFARNEARYEARNAPVNARDRGLMLRAHSAAAAFNKREWESSLRARPRPRH